MEDRRKQALKDLYTLLLEEHRAALLEDRDVEVNVDDIPVDAMHAVTSVLPVASQDAVRSLLDHSEAGPPNGTGKPRNGTTHGLAELLDRVEADKLATGSWTQRTARHTRQKVEHFLAHAGMGTQIEDITRDMVREWRDTLNLAPNTVNLYLRHLGSVLSWAKDEGIIDVNPTEGLQVRVTATDRDSVSDEEHATITAFAEQAGGWKPLMILAVAKTGMRIAEACQIQGKDIATVEGVRCFHLTEARHQLKNTNSARIVPVHPDLNPLVDNLGPEDYLLPIGTQNPAASAGNWFARTLRMNIKLRSEVVLHSYRKRAATRMMRGGVPEHVAAALLGHSVGQTLSYGLYATSHEVAQLQEAIQHL